jgi:hypothetical protein
MKMDRKALRLITTLAVASSLIVSTGCSTSANLYPVRGPLSEHKPLPVITAKVSGITGNTGSISLTLPDGEVCKGTWSSATGMSASFGTVNLFSQYGSTLGSGFSVGNVPSVNRGKAIEAIIIGEKGTVMEVEFYTGSGTGDGFGFAKDNHGNLFNVQSTAVVQKSCLAW